VLPAAQAADAAEFGFIHLQVVAVTIAIDGAFDMGRFQFAAGIEQYAVAVDKELGDVKGTAGEFTGSHDYKSAMVTRGGAQFFHRRTGGGETVLVVALHEPQS